MIEELRKKLGEAGFGNLRLADSVFSVGKNTLKLRFITPEKFGEDAKKAVAGAVTEFLKDRLRQEIKPQCVFEKDYMDCDKAKTVLLKYAGENFPSLAAMVSDTLEAAQAGDGSIELKFTVNNENFLLFKQMGAVEQFNENFKSITGFKVTVKADVVRADTDKEELRDWAKRKQELQIAKASFRPQRSINVENVVEYIGRGVAERPKYIIDAAEREEKYVTVCGRVQSPREVVTASGYTLFKFEVADHTSSISVVMFPSEDPEMLRKLKALEQGEEVILNGAVALNKYSNNMEFKAYRVSKCRINEPDYLSLKTREVPADYVNVREEDFVLPRQSTLFGEKKLPENLKGKTFVVFDLETTGKEFLRDKIIEVGAVKIEDGVISKKFASFVNPERDIPREITELTGITAKDVEKAPVFEEIIADFYKFSHGFPLVAHNIEFDYSFLRFNTKDSGYIFSQRQIDTLSLARKFFAQPANRDNRPPDYKLSTLAPFMGIECLNAHRAIDDAKITAEMFLKIMAVYEG